jgi:hypothetical protein
MSMPYVLPFLSFSHIAAWSDVWRVHVCIALLLVFFFFFCTFFWILRRSDTYGILCVTLAFLFSSWLFYCSRRVLCMFNRIFAYEQPLYVI